MAQNTILFFHSMSMLHFLHCLVFLFLCFPLPRLACQSRGWIGTCGHGRMPSASGMKRHPGVLMMARALAGFPTRFVRPPAQSPSGGKKNWRFLNFSASSRYTVILLAARTQYTTRYPVSGGFLVKYDRTEVKQKRTHKTETELKKIVP